MKLLQPHLLSLTALLLAISPVFAQEMEQAPVPTPEQPKQEKQERMKPEREMRERQRTADPIAPPAHNTQGRPLPWRIGLLAEDVDPVLRAHLAIPENSGITVTSVAPGSPAAQQGLKVNDIITKANEAPVKNIEQLRHQVELSASRLVPLHLSFLRAGKMNTITIKPLVPGVQPAPNRAQQAMEPFIQRIAEQNKKMGSLIERQQQEINELRKQIKELRDDIKRDKKADAPEKKERKD